MAMSASAGRTAWLAVALLIPVALLNYLDRQLIATMQKSIMAGVSGFDGPDRMEKWGHMLAWFKWTYALASPLAGLVADRVSRRWVICASLFIWSADTWATSLVTTYDQLVVTRAVMGLSEAFYIPAALALIADHHAGGTRSRAVGLHQVGIYAGVMLGSMGGFAADDPDIGWAGSFAFLGGLGVLYSLPLLLLLKETGRPGEKTAERPADSVRELLGNRNFLLLLAYFTLPALAGWVIRDWMPSVLQKDLGLTQGLAGFSAVIWWQSAAVVSAVAGGWLADRRMRGSDRGRIQVSALGMALIIPAMLGVGLVIDRGSLGLAIAFLMLFGVGWGLFDSNNMPILAQIARPGLRATGYGLMNLVSISCGGLADVGFGWLRDRNVPLDLVFGGFAAIACLSAWLVLSIRLPQKDDR
jgi:MFS family permease